MAPTTLDPAAARPLTSREIGKVLCSILAGVIVFDPRARQAVPAVIDAVRRQADVAEVTTIGLRHSWGQPALNVGAHAAASWATAISATVAGFHGWCAPADIITALNWVAQNLDEICPPIVSVVA